MDEKDPRHNRKHKERGPAKLSFTVEDLQELTGLAKGTLYNDAGKWKVKLPGSRYSLEALVNYIVLHRKPSK